MDTLAGRCLNLNDPFRNTAGSDCKDWENDKTHCYLADFLKRQGALCF